MDGTKRNARGEPILQPLIDLGSTPPWALPPIYHEESALRYTQSPASKDSKRTVSLLQLESDDDLPLRVDSANGADTVYMLNAREDSWCSSLASEDQPGAQERLPEQAELALVHLKRAQELAERRKQALVPQRRFQHFAKKPTFDGFRSEEERQNWQNDHLLSNIMRRIKSKLRGGATLTVEYSGVAALTTTCAHPFCPAGGRKIPAAAYYVILGQPQHLESAECFCLTCIENLWNGEGMHWPFPDPQVEVEKRAGGLERGVVGLDLDGANTLNDPLRRDSKAGSPLLKPVQHPQLDGPNGIPKELLTSKHAPTPEELTDEYLASITNRQVSTSEPASPDDSVTSQGEWQHPPTRFQHLAPFIRAGNSLRDEEKAAVKVWKAASEEQLQWEKHLKTTSDREREREAAVDDGVEVESDEEDVSKMHMARRMNGNASDALEAEDEAEEIVTAMSEKDFRGKDLSIVLERSDNKN